MPSCALPGTDDIIQFGLHEYLMEFLTESRIWATKSAVTSLVPTF
jgi:hypothetical protein